jgi:hypothetical protein
MTGHITISGVTGSVTTNDHKNGIAIAFTLNNLFPGYHQGTLTLTALLAEQKKAIEVVIPMCVNVDSGIESAPTVIAIPRTSVRKKRATEVTFHSSRWRQLSVKAVSIRPTFHAPQAECFDIAMTEHGQSATARITFAPKEAGVHEAILSLEFEHEGQETVKLLVPIISQAY